MDLLLKKSGASPSQKIYLHGDYDLNLRKAKVFISNIQGELLPGMSVAIRSSLAYPESILELYWHSSNQMSVGNFSFPVVLHQANVVFRKELGGAFNNLFQLAGRWTKQIIPV